LPSTSCTLVSPVSPNNKKETIGMPYLDVLNLEGCNCLKREKGLYKVIVSKDVNRVDNEDDEQAAMMIERQSADNDEHFLTFQIKGSTYNPESQASLKKARDNIANRNIYFVFESNNIKDKNAIKIVKQVNDKEETLGYVPKERIKQITFCIKAKNIVNSHLVSVVRKFVPSIKANIYLGEISIAVKGSIPAIDNTYFYNKDLH